MIICEIETLRDMRAYFGEKPLSNSCDVFFFSLHSLAFFYVKLHTYSSHFIFKTHLIAQRWFSIKIRAQAGFEVLLTLSIFNLSARNHYVCLGVVNAQSYRE